MSRFMWRCIRYAYLLDFQQIFFSIPVICYVLCTFLYGQKCQQKQNSTTMAATDTQEKTHVSVDECQSLS